MIVNSTSTRAVSNLGWVDKGALWVFDSSGVRPTRIEVSDAKYLSIVAGSEDYFAVVHHYDDDRLLLTAHAFSDAGTPLAKVKLLPSGAGAAGPPNTKRGVDANFTGDAAMWSLCPHAYVAYAFGDFHLFSINAEVRKVEVQSFPWFDESYDHGYQGIIGIVQVPGSELLVVSVQRDSEPVLYDPVARKVVRKLFLANRRGNPKLYFRKKAPELLASDYDTLVCLNSEDWRRLRSLRVEQDTPENLQQFMGEYFVDPAEELCLIARPFSGDIAVVNPNDFKIRQNIPIGRQPLEVALLKGELIVARDWKTGELLTTRFRS